MMAGCMLRPQGDATRNSKASGRNNPATAQSDRLPVSAMTGSELRAQLRMQRRCNSPVAADATSPGTEATPRNLPAPGEMLVADEARARRWQVTLPDRPPFMVAVIPPADAAWMQHLYPAQKLSL